MKKLSILFLSLLTSGLAISSCSSNDVSEDKDDKVSVTGKWEYSKTGYIKDNKEILSDYVHSTECGKDYVEFLSDGTSTEVFFNYENTGRCTGFNRKGKYIKDELTLTLLNGEQPKIYKILVLDSNTLKLTRTLTADNQTFSSIVIYKKI